MLSSLRYKLMVFMVAFIFVAVLAQVGVGVYVFRNQLIAKENDKIINYTEFSSSGFLDAYNKYYLNDFDQFRLVAKKILGTMGVVESVKMVDIKGNILFDTQDVSRKDFKTLGGADKDVLDVIAQAKVQTIRTKGVVSKVVYPIVEDLDFHKYTLIYYISYEPVMQQVVSSTVSTFAFLIPAMILLFMLAIIFVFKTLKPISELDAGVKKINSGNLDYKLKIEGGDEIAQIALGFNKMAQDYKYAMLKSQRVGLLEGEVKARQKELEDQFKDLQLKSEEIENFKKALLNLSEDATNSRDLAISERDKTLAIINGMADGMAVFDKNDKLTLANPQFEDFFEVKKDDVLDKKISDFAKSQKLAPIKELFPKGIEPFYRKEISISENLILEVSSVFIKKGEEVAAKLVSFHDVTREKMVEKTKSEFVSIAAHQLRTPLSAIKWIFQMMRDGDWGKVTKEQGEYLNKGFVSTERLIRVVNDLLNVSRIEEGRFAQKMEKLQLEDVLKSVCEQHVSLAETKKLKFVYHKPDHSLPTVSADKEQIRIAVENLIENAMNYTNENGLVEVFIKKSQDGNSVEVSVKDSGIGIPQEQQERIFTKFYRSSNALRKETSGSGLGLFVTRNIIESHGGKIWFESIEGTGTTFFFVLPAA
jgi:PAS domain S-box-containing protein